MRGKAGLVLAVILIALTVVAACGGGGGGGSTSAPNLDTNGNTPPSGNAPTITDVNPGEGAEGTTVIIIGTNFTTFSASPEIIFNGQPAIATEITSTALTVAVPVGATTGPISVVTQGGSATSPSSFTVISGTAGGGAPTITAISPSSGAVGITVTITGTNFSTTALYNTVQFNGISATVTAATTTSLKATVPTGATTGPIKVITQGGSATSASNFTVTSAPTISAISPSSGAIGITVTITGTNFSTTAANNTVKFNGTSATVTAATTTSLKATVPTGATTGKITVTTTGGYATSASSFTVTSGTTSGSAPTISAISPSTGAIGITVTITGTNFSTTAANNTVKFNGTSATVTAATTTALKATVPSGATTGKVTVATTGGTATSASSYTVTGGTTGGSGAPTITSISPLKGKVGSQVLIKGTNFSTVQPDNLVYFNGTSAGGLFIDAVPTTTSLRAAVPSGATPGKITVTNAAGTATSADDFTVDTGYYQACGSGAGTANPTTMIIMIANVYDTSVCCDASCNYKYIGVGSESECKSKAAAWVLANTSTGGTGGSCASPCTSLTYLGSANDPQFDSNCQLAQFDACIHEKCNDTTYDAEGRTACSILDAQITGTGSTWSCRYCPFPY